MRPDSELETSIKKDVCGEWNKLKECYQQLSRGVAAHEPARGIYSDCFLLHARNLIDFLTNKKSGNDDVLITHFVGNGMYFKEREILPPNIKLPDPYKRINKQLSHITYSRLDPNQYNFFGEDGYYKTIFKNIKDKIEEYNKNVRKKEFIIT
jgi:hypothetical protein